MSLLRLSLVVLAAGCVAGCGGNDRPTTYPLTGTVTFDGKPVPVGTVTVLPDAGGGGLGAAVAIKDGACPQVCRSSCGGRSRSENTPQLTRKPKATASEAKLGRRRSR
jgi:hypothetical protein